MHGRIGFVGLACLPFLIGCSELPTPTQEPSQADKALAESFDPGATGTIRGRVVWEGDIPRAEEFLVRTNAFNPYLHKNPARFTTPHLPQVHAENRGVANAVVYLRGIDQRRSKKWDHPSVSVEFHDRQLLVAQGNERCNVGFVRRGDSIKIANLDDEYHNLHVRGAAFFAIPLLEAKRVHERKLTEAGIVDLSCGVGYYWMHAHLFVVEHPYYARTDAEGRFTFEHVPAGTYEMVCWLPSWHVARKEIDPETAIIARWAWQAPKEQMATVNIESGRVLEMNVRWTARMFD